MKPTEQEKTILCKTELKVLRKRLQEERLEFEKIKLENSRLKRRLQERKIKCIKKQKILDLRQTQIKDKLHTLMIELVIEMNQRPPKLKDLEKIKELNTMTTLLRGLI